jgi:hypothetical protein
MIERAAGLAIAGIFAIACSSPSSVASPRGSPTPSAGVYLGSLGSAGCKPAAVVHSESGLPDVGIDSSRGSFWALFFASVPPPTGKDIKVIWRMTGSGPFTFKASDAHGMTVALDWGPDAHTGSNWNHPGDEVGTGFTFPHSGCWNIHVSRSDVAGDVWFEVAG